MRKLNVRVEDDFDAGRQLRGHREEGDGRGRGELEGKIQVNDLCLFFYVMIVMIVYITVTTFLKVESSDIVKVHQSNVIMSHHYCPTSYSTPHHHCGVYQNKELCPRQMSRTGPTGPVSANATNARLYSSKVLIYPPIRAYLTHMAWCLVQL